MSAPHDIAALMSCHPILADAGADQALAGALLETGHAFTGRPFRASTPGFKAYESDELVGCASGAFPAFSITGGACALNCAHCRAKILEPMIPALSPDLFEARVRAMIERQGLRGFLLSGGSNRRNEVKFEHYLPVIERLKREHPALEVLVHSGLVDDTRARLLKSAGVDVAMLDMIGDDETIRDVYNLGRPVADFEASLAALVEAGLNTVPHIVVGLHFGRLKGEDAALSMIARHQTRAAILVVIMPHFAEPGSFQPVDLEEAGAFFGRARAVLDDRLLLLGCARPHGAARERLDAYALLAGFDGIAYPSDGIMALAATLGRPAGHAQACCGTQSCRKAA